MNPQKAFAVIAWCTSNSDIEIAKELLKEASFGSAGIILKRHNNFFQVVAGSLNISKLPEKFSSVRHAWNWIRENKPELKIYVEAKFNNAKLTLDTPKKFLQRCSQVNNDEMVCNYINFTDAFFSYSRLGNSATEIKEGFVFLGPDKNEIIAFIRNNRTHYLKAPQIIALDLSPQCSKQCRKCLFHSPVSPFKQMIPGKEKMSFEMAQMLIRQAAEFDPKPVIAPTFSGEPLLYPNIIELLREAKSLKLPVSVTTNGMLMNEKVAKALADIEVNTIMISLDASKETTYRKLQAPGSLDKIRKNIHFLQDYCSDKNTQIGLTYVAEDENEEEFSDFLKEWNDTDYIVKSHKLDMINYGNPINPRNANAPTKIPCITSFSGLYIRYNGRISLCGYDLLSDHVNLVAGPGITLKEIWHSEEMISWKEKMLNPPYAYNFCGQCACKETQFSWNLTQENYDVSISPITKIYKAQRNK